MKISTKTKSYQGKDNKQFELVELPKTNHESIYKNHNYSSIE